MKFACFSVEGTALSWWKRLVDEGNEVLVYIESKHGPTKVGDGIVPKTGNYAEWVKWGQGGIYFFDCTGQGVRADLLRRAGEKVVGGSKFCDKLESDRNWSSQLVEDIGIRVPEYKSFNTIGATRNFLKSNKKDWVFKSNKYIDASATYMAHNTQDMEKYLEYLQSKHGDNVSNILQEKLDGFALSTARWWNGNSWAGPYESTLEHKKLMDGDIGPATGCSLNMITFYKSDTPSIAKALKFEELGEKFRNEQASPGLYDINALLSEDDGEPYFLEFTPRLGFDSEPTSQKGIKDLGKLLSDLAGGLDVNDLFDRSKVYCSVRLSVEPYPWESVTAHDKVTCLDTPVMNQDGLWSGDFIAYGLRFDKKKGLVVADPFGLVGLASGTGDNARRAFEGAYKMLEGDFQVPNLQYRTDAIKMIEDDIKTILSLGYEVR